jgi:hypothetical protein
MANTSTSAATALGFLTSEAASLLQQAKVYRDEMNKLEQNDPRREVYEKSIRDLVDRASRMSITVTTSTSSLK